MGVSAELMKFIFWKKDKIWLECQCKELEYALKDGNTSSTT